MKSTLPIRSMYRAAKGNLLYAFDLAAAEAWVVAHLANDYNMKRELATGDLHCFAACGIFDKPVPPGEGKKRYIGVIDKDERYVGKKMNHSCNYRTGPFTIAEMINEEGIMTVSLSEAKVFHSKWLKTYNLYTWWSEVDEQLQRNRTFTTVYGFRRKFWGIMNDKLKKEATAFEPQSTVGDHMHGAVQDELGIEGGNLAIYKHLVVPSKGEIKMINTAHDSVILEAPAVLKDSLIPQVVSYLRRPLIIKGQQFTIPVDAEVGERWMEFEQVKVA